MFTGRIFSLKSDQLPRGGSEERVKGGNTMYLLVLPAFYMRNEEGIQEMGNHFRDAGL